jgi:hypothetical protein
MIAGQRAKLLPACTYQWLGKPLFGMISECKRCADLHTSGYIYAGQSSMDGTTKSGRPCLAECCHHSGPHCLHKSQYHLDTGRDQCHAQPCLSGRSEFPCSPQVILGCNSERNHCLSHEHYRQALRRAHGAYVRRLIQPVATKQGSAAGGTVRGEASLMESFGGDGQPWLRTKLFFQGFAVDESRETQP